MRASVMFLAATALPACAASAQMQGGWEFALEGGVGTAEDPLRPGQATATVTLWAKFQVDSTLGLAIAAFSVHAAEPGWSDLELLPLQIPPIPPLGGVPGEIVGGDVHGIATGQLAVFGFLPDPSNPIALWRAQFTVTDFTEREISLSTLTEDFALHPPPIGEFLIRPPVVEGSGAIYIVPAPAAPALLGLGVLVATRRRR